MFPCLCQKAKDSSVCTSIRIQLYSPHVLDKSGFGEILWNLLHHILLYLLGIFRTQFCLYRMCIHICIRVYGHGYLFNVEVESVLKTSLADKTTSQIQKM